MSPPLVPLRGSERRPMVGAWRAGAFDGGAPVEVSVVLRPGVDDASAGAPTEAGTPRPAAEADVDAVGAYARERGLDVTVTDAGRRVVGLRGPAAAMAAAFGVTLERWEDAGGAVHRGREGPVRVPPGLLGRVTAVLGLDDRPQARPFVRLLDEDRRGGRDAGAGYTPVEVGQLYSFPEGLDGSGVTIALVELGGGYDAADLRRYFRQLGVPMPTVVAVGVDGAANARRRRPDHDSEVCLDVCVAGALAPGARQVVYFAPNTDRGFYDAVSAAVTDRVHRPTIVSISWGGAEAEWTLQAAAAMDSLLAEAAALGVTVLTASGDAGATDGLADGRLHATFPASSPSSLACGGTRLVAAHGAIAAETVWNATARGGGATGGGVSALFPRPAYQARAAVPDCPTRPGWRGRGVPDVAGDADPETGYRVRVDGADVVVGGTSAVAPLWAALLARCTQAVGAPLGLVQPWLYGLPPSGGGFRDVVSGGNAGFAAGRGWDACTGLGSPHGAALLASLQGRRRARVTRAG